MEYASPNRTKILHLNEKLKQLDNDDRATSPSIEAKIPNLEWRIHNLSQKLKKTSSKDDARYKPLEMEMSIMEDLFRNQKREFEIAIADREENIRQVERSITGIVQQLSNDLKDERFGISRGLQQKVKVVKCEYSETTIAFSQMCSKKTQQINLRVEQVKQTIDNQRNSRNQTSQFLIRSFGQQILKLQQLLKAEKTERIRQNKQAISLINQIEDNLDEQIKQEKQIKSRNQQVFTRLLEQTCYKIQQSFLQ